MPALRFKHACLLLSLTTVLYFCSGSSASDPPVKELVQAEYLKALVRLQDQFDHCHGDGLLTSYRLTDDLNAHPTDIKRRWVEFSFAGDSAKTVTSSTNPIDPDSVLETAVDLPKIKSARDLTTQNITCFNNKYSFSLLMKNLNYSVRSLEPGDTAGRKIIKNGSASAVHAAYTAYHIAISTLFGIKDFRLDRVTRLGPDADSRLKFDFSVTERPLVAPSAARILSGWFIVSPDQQWLVHEYGIVRNWISSKQSTNVGHVEYQAGTDGRSHPVKTSYRSYHGRYSADPAASQPEVAPFAVEEFRFAQFEFGDEPKSIFSLSHYGLPEFGKTVTQVAAARSFPWWTVGAAIGLGGLAFVLRRLARRQPAVAPKVG